MKDLMYCNSDNNFIFASQPTIENYNDLKNEGVEIVVNLRAEGEGDFTAHQKACEDLGMVYLQASFFGPNGIDKENVEKINKLIAENKDKKAFVHCASANRTGGWYAIYLNTVEGIELEDAIERAFSTNNMRPPMDDMVRDFLD